MQCGLVEASFKLLVKNSACKTCVCHQLSLITQQGGITCEAIDEPRKSSKAIDKRVIIDFRDKNVVIARFHDKNEAFILSL